MKTVTLISRHYAFADRKAGFHHIAESLKKDYQVQFITIDFSFLSRFANDYRNRINKKNFNRIIENNNVVSYLKKTPFHLVGIHPIIDFFSGFLTVLYKHLFFDKNVKKLIQQSDVVLIESSSAVIFPEVLKRIRPEVKIIYRVSDLVKELSHIHPVFIKSEKKCDQLCEVISTPTRYIYNYHKNILGCGRVFLDYHGISKAQFDTSSKNPYSEIPGKHPEQKFSKNAVFAGVSKIDHENLNKIAEFNPNVLFHYFGPVILNKKYLNVRAYGTRPFKEIVPYIKFADYGLHLVKDKTLLAYGDSLKVLQYTYCGLPVIAPEGMESQRPNFIFFNPENPQSLKNIFEKAEKIRGKNFFKYLRKEIKNWDELTKELLKRTEI